MKRVITGRPFDVPRDLIALLRQWPQDMNEGLTRVGDDIWFTDKPVAMHCDSTTDGLMTHGIILLNDDCHVLVYGDTVYELPVGSLYHIDGRIPHGTLKTANSGGGLCNST